VTTGLPAHLVQCRARLHGGRCRHRCGQR
jgi:hypothetical protein